jgi:predicted MFS family arabinose efflux permease
LLAAAGFLSSAGARVVDPLLALVAQDFDTSVSAVSVVLAAFSVSYGVFQLVLGPLSDTFGKLRLILLALLGYTAFTGACALASNVASLTVLRACSGAASAGLIPVCLAYIGDTVPYERRQLTLSRFLVGVMLAQTVAGPLSGGFGQYVGWRAVFLLLAAIALLLAVVLRAQLDGLADRAGTATFTRANYAALARGVFAARRDRASARSRAARAAGRFGRPCRDRHVHPGELCRPGARTRRPLPAARNIGGG